MDIRCTEHLVNITEKAPQLLVTLEYDQSQMAGPPFSNKQEEIDKHYEGSQSPLSLCTKDEETKLNTSIHIKEKIWHLQA